MFDNTLSFGKIREERNNEDREALASLSRKQHLCESRTCRKYTDVRTYCENVTNEVYSTDPCLVILRLKLELNKLNCCMAVSGSLWSCSETGWSVGLFVRLQIDMWISPFLQLITCSIWIDLRLVQCYLCRGVHITVGTFLELFGDTQTTRQKPTCSTLVHAMLKKFTSDYI